MGDKDVMAWPDRAAGDDGMLREGDEDDKEEDEPSCVHIETLEEAGGADAPERSGRRSCIPPLLPIAC